MDSVIEKVKLYLGQTLNIQPYIRSWKGSDQLPLFIADSYEFYEMPLFEQPCLLMVAIGDEITTPARVKKHWEQVVKRWKKPCIYIQSTISTYNRKRLIQHRISFIIPGNQMYLPDLGIDLRERVRKPLSETRPFKPATQAAIIYALLHGTGDRLCPSKLAQELGYSRMTMSRAFDALEAAGIGQMVRQGKERRWHFKGNRAELWEQARPLMRNPVKNRIWLSEKPSRIIAGLSALAHFSNLNPPPIPVYAIGSEAWHNQKKAGAIELPTPEEASYELEVWHYAPALFAEEGVADPFSLYLSLQDSRDERIESALSEMMRRFAC